MRTLKSFAAGFLALVLASAPVAASAQMLLLGAGARPAAGGGASGMWDAANKNAGVNLSGGALVATAGIGTGSSWSVKSTTSHTTGKYCYEFTDTVRVNSITMGFGTAAAVLTDAPGNNADSKGWAVDGNVMYGGGGATTGVTASAVGVVKMICIDLGNQRTWALNNAGQWNNNGSADPATNTLGSSYTFTGTVFAQGSVRQLNDSFSTNFAGPFVNTLPSGFSAWNFIIFGAFRRRRAANDNARTLGMAA